MKCNHCNAEIPDDSKFCTACGKQPQTAGAVFCSACGAISAEGQSFCSKCGKKLEPATSAANYAATPPQTAPQPEYKPSLANTPQTLVTDTRQLAGVGLRCIDGIIDTVVLFIIGFIIALFTGQTTAGGFELHGLPAFVWWIVGFGYYVFFESKLGATPGKMLLGLRVIKTDGAACDMRAAVIRTVCRIVDNFFIIGVIIMMFSKLNQRLGDRLADTIVIKTREVKFSQVKNDQFGTFDD